MHLQLKNKKHTQAVLELVLERLHPQFHALLQYDEAIAGM